MPPFDHPILDHPVKYQTNLIWDVDSGAYRPTFSSDLAGQSLSQEVGGISLLNSTTGALAAGLSWTGQYEDVSAYPSVVVAAKTDKDGKLYMEFSPDGANWDSSLSFSVSSGVNEVHRLTTTRGYYRTKFENTGSLDQGYLRLQTLYGKQTALTSALNSPIQGDADTLLTRGVIIGQTDGGIYKNVPVTSEGHLEVAIHGPRNPFGSIHVENLTPIFQMDGVYGRNTQLLRVTTGLGGVYSESDSQFVMSTQASVGGNSTIQSTKRLRYRPGQGAVARFTSTFSTGVANSIQIAGVGHPEDGIYFGYSGQNFGILHSRAGIREVRTVTLTNPASVAGALAITLNGVNFTANVTNSANLARTAYEISTGTYNGWTVEPTQSGCVFLASSVGGKNGSFLLSGQSTLATGSFSQTRSGVALTENWITQDNWNIDTADGNGPSAMNLDPTKGNVYQIGYQYLGYGAITFQIENAAEGNNPDFVSVHSISYPNSNTTPSFRNPSFPFTASAYSMGSTTNLDVKVGSFAGFIEGQKILNGPQFTYTETSTAVAASAYKALFTIKNSLVFKSKSNQSVVNLLNINGAAKANQPTTIVVIKNAELTGTPVFNRYSENSCTLYDNNATNATFTSNEQVIFSFSLGDAGQESYNLADFGFDLQPGESITIAAKTAAATASYVSVSINTREDT